MNNINKKAVICLFLVIVLVIILKSFSVSGFGVTASFTSANSAPLAPHGIQLQDASDKCGGDSWDTNVNNLTTHMLNATLRWNESDPSDDEVWTFVCIASTRARIDEVNTTNKTSGSQCDIIHFWNWTEDGKVNNPLNHGALDDNRTGVNLDNASGGTSVDYSGTHKVYYGALAAYDNKTEDNISSKVLFNITILNHLPSVTGFNTTATHDQTPSIGWHYLNDTDNGTKADYCPEDNVTFLLYIGSLVSGNNDNLSETNLAKANYTLTSTLPWNMSKTSDGLWSNATYYYRINVTDQHNGTVSTNLEGSFQLTDNLPTKPCQFNITKTHEQSPNVAWGCGNETDGDVVTLSITAGTTVNGTEILGNTEQSSNESGSFFAQSIDWNSTANKEYANTTVFMVIGAYDDASGLTKGVGNYTASFMLYDKLPNITAVYMSDNNYLSTYTDCNAASTPCKFDPIGGGNITLAANITTYDPDNDCSLGSYGNVTLFLCINSTTNGGCDDKANNNFTFYLSQINSRGTGICEWKFTGNLTGGNRTPEFFISNNTYKYYINATSQTGVRIDDDNSRSNGSWEFRWKEQVNFPSSISVGTTSITLDAWNDDVDGNTMTNYGNQVVYMRWNSTNFTRTGETNMNWSLRGWDFLLDDDNDHNAETSGKIAPVNLTTNKGLDIYFNYSTGLEVCIKKECDETTLNETMDTYWHINPPNGLGAGEFSATITYTVTSVAGVNMSD